MNLDPDHIDIWTIKVELDAVYLGDLYSQLSDSEKKAAKQFHHERDANRFITGRAFLRLLLANYQNTNPSELTLRSTEKGKPFLQHSKIRFNVSKSQDYILIALARDFEIGIDIEFVKNDIDVLEITKNFFTTTEYSILKGVRNNDRRLTCFYKCWTRKEALIKATGDGLTFPLDQIEVGMNSGCNEFVQVSDKTRPAINWSLHNLQVPENYIGALAYQGSKNSLRYFKWPSAKAMLNF